MIGFSGKMISIVLTMSVATVSGLLFRKLRFPGGMIVGAIIGVGALHVCTEYAYFPTRMQIISQIVVGAFLGCTMTREHLRRLPSSRKVILCVVVSYLALNILVGLLTCQIADIDLLTALFCVCPGGMNDTTLVALDMGAVVTSVVAMQMLRVIYGLAIIPVIITVASRLSRRDELAKRAKATAKREKKEKKAPSSNGIKSTKAVVVTLVVATVGGLIGKYTGMPAGTLLFAMMFTIVLKINRDEAHLPIKIRRCAQILSGCCIGIRINEEELMTLRMLLLPALIMLLAYTLVCIFVGIFIAKKFDMSVCEGMLCLAPASPSEMTLLADELNIVNPGLTVVQICRQITAAVVFPQIFRLLNLLMSG